MAKLKIGDPVIPFDLPGVDGKRYGPGAFPERELVAVIFWCNHCPYVQAWEQRVIDLQAAWRPRGVELLLVSSNDPTQYPDDSFEKMKERAREKGYTSVYLFDENQDVARAYGAERTPEVFLFDRQRVLRYHGKPDDNFEDAAAVRQHYLEDAIRALLEGRRPPVTETPPQGCTIKWRR